MFSVSGTQVSCRSVESGFLPIDQGGLVIPAQLKFAEQDPIHGISTVHQALKHPSQGRKVQFIPGMGPKRTLKPVFASQEFDGSTNHAWSAFKSKGDLDCRLHDPSRGGLQEVIVPIQTHSQAPGKMSVSLKASIKSSGTIADPIYAD